MSGVETAGLILGALPLIIAGIEKYNEGLDPIKAFYSWEKDLPKYIERLRVQHVQFGQSIQLLFAQITDSDELAKMMFDPIMSWKNEELAKKLQLKLHDAYGAFQTVMKEISKIIVKIAQKLDLERADQIDRPELEALLVGNPQDSTRKFHFRKRVKFGMNKKKIKALLEDLNANNHQLERLTDKSEKIELLRRSCKPSVARRAQRIQAYAKMLHSVLVQSWTCSCRSSHNTNLRLEQRLNVPSSKGHQLKREDQSDMRFSLWFWSQSGPCNWQQAQVEILPTESTSVSTSTSSLTLQKTLSARSVSFGPIASSSTSTFSQASTIMQTSSRNEEVQDLCATISQHVHPMCLTFELGPCGTLRSAARHDSSVATASPVAAGSFANNGQLPVCSETQSKGTTVMTTLDNLLDRHARGDGLKLSRKERYVLAVTLASSAIQLYSTSWLEDQWGKKDVLFRYNAVGAARTIDLEHPYVAQRPKPAVDQTTAPKNMILLALAVMLLELYFGTPVERVKFKGHSNDATSPWALLAMTAEWLDQKQDDLSSAFSTAVRSCLQFFHDSSNSLLEPSHLQAAIEGIVLPLQDELMQFLGKTTP